MAETPRINAGSAEINRLSTARYRHHVTDVAERRGVRERDLAYEVAMEAARAEAILASIPEGLRPAMLGALRPDEVIMLATRRMRGVA